jgi:hypothetical protein
VGNFISFLEMCQKDEMKHEKQESVSFSVMADMCHKRCCHRNDWALLRSWKCAVVSGSVIPVFWCICSSLSG